MIDISYNLQCGRFTLDFNRPKVMGIVNVTPDSFSDGGQYNHQKSAINHAYQLIEQGADILDIGGESSRPGSDPVSLEEELKRVVPIIKELLQAQIPLSIDSFKPEVMQACLDLGVDMVNDIYALRQPAALDVIAAYPQSAVCIMHMHGDPKTMQINPPDYGSDITSAVYKFLNDRIHSIEEANIDKSRIIVDPGFGFGKTVTQNFELLRNLHSLSGLGLPILTGLSRKSMIGAVTGAEVDKRVSASVTAALACADRGASILRVHDVEETVQALKVWQTIKTGVINGT